VYSSPNITLVITNRRMKCAGHAACMGVRWGANRVLVGKPEGICGSPGHSYWKLIKMGLYRETATNGIPLFDQHPYCGAMYTSDVVNVVNAVRNLLCFFRLSFFIIL
jgi:hypothetical protein